MKLRLLVVVLALVPLLLLGEEAQADLTADAVMSKRLGVRVTDSHALTLATTLRVAQRLHFRVRYWRRASPSVIHLAVASPVELETPHGWESGWQMESTLTLRRTPRGGLTAYHLAYGQLALR